MKTIREDLMGDSGTLDSGFRAALDVLECKVWQKWDQLKASSWALRLIGGTVEAKVLRPILGERPAGCIG